MTRQDINFFMVCATVITAVLVIFTFAFVMLAYSTPRTNEKTIKLDDGRHVTCVYAIVTPAIDCDWENAR